jgi:hypothetical protein
MPQRPDGSRQRPLLDALADGLLALMSPEMSPRSGDARSLVPSHARIAPQGGYGCYDFPTYRRRGVRIPELETGT